MDEAVFVGSAIVAALIISTYGVKQLKRMADHLAFREWLERRQIAKKEQRADERQKRLNGKRRF